MTAFPTFERWYASWQIRSAVRRLDHPDEATRARATEHLRACSPDCWPVLRRAAFCPHSRLAVTAAELLVTLGDAQGLYALLEHFSNSHMYGQYGQKLRRALSQVGSEKILSVLEGALQRIETPPLAREHWSLALSVYALRALKALNAPIPNRIWRRAIMAYVSGYESLRICRAVLPIVSVEDTNVSWAFYFNELYIGSALAAVRRAAVDALLLMNREGAFDLLREAIGHSAAQVQLTAVYGLSRLKDPRAYVLLQPLAADRRHPLTKDARRAIEALGTKEPDVLTLVRASQPIQAAPEELLRPAVGGGEYAPETLLHPVNAEEAPSPPPGNQDLR